VIRPPAPAGTPTATLKRIGRSSCSAGVAIEKDGSGVGEGDAEGASDGLSVDVGVAVDCGAPEAEADGLAVEHPGAASPSARTIAIPRTIPRSLRMRMGMAVCVGDLS
jgi:hypothetical protein